MSKIVKKVPRKELIAEIKALESRVDEQGTQIAQLQADWQRLTEMNKQLVAEKTVDICGYFQECMLANALCIGQTPQRTSCKMFEKFETYVKEAVNV